MLRRFTTQEYEKMATEIASRFAADTEQDLEGMVVKHACGMGMLPDQIRNLVHSLNNMAFLKLFEKEKALGNDPTGEFPVVNPESAIAKADEGVEEPGGSDCNGSCKSCVLSDDGGCGGSSEYDAISDLHGDFPDLLGSGGSPDGATVKITIEKSASVRDQFDITAEVPDPRIHRDNVIRIERVKEAVTERKYAAAFEVQENVEKLAYELQRVGAPDLSRVQMLVNALDDPIVKRAFVMVLGQMDKDPEKIAAHRTPRAYDPKEAPLPELIKIADGLKKIRVIDAAERKVERYVAALGR